MFGLKKFKLPQSEEVKEFLSQQRARLGPIHRITTTWKQCPKCGLFKRTAEEFYEDNYQSSGWSSRCKSCTRTRTGGKKAGTTVNGE